MPDSPKTPIRTVRVDDDLWKTFGEAVGDRSAGIRDLMRWYLREPGAKAPRRPGASVRERPAGTP